MSVRRSEIVGTPVRADDASAWGAMLRSNWMIPVVLLLLWPAQWVVVKSGWVDAYAQRIVMLIGINITLAVSLQLINGISGQFSLGHAGFMAVGAYLAAYPAQTYSPKGDEPLAVLWFYLVLGAFVAVVGAALVGAFVGLRYARRVRGLRPVLLVVVPVWFVVDVATAARLEDEVVPPYLVWSHLLDWLQRGFSGLLEWGQPMAVRASHYFQHAPDFWFWTLAAALVALIGGASIGAIVVLRRSRRLGAALLPISVLLVLVWLVVDVLVATRFGYPIIPVWSRRVDWLLHLGASYLGGTMPTLLTFVLLLLGAGSFAAVAGLVVGIPTLRLRGDYLAIATLGFAEIIRVTITNSPPLGGALGLNLLPKFSSFAWVYGVAIVTVIVVWRIVHSARGRALLAVREDEVAAAAVGIHTTRSKVMAFVVGAFLAGVAGGLFAHYDTYIAPQEFSFMRSVELVVMVTLAGSGSISGTIVAAVVLTYLPEFLRRLPPPFRQLSEFRMVVYSLILVLMMLLRPAGLLGNRELWWTRRRMVSETAPDEAAGE
jgi:branched-chain amino acid transport system permease protein